ncbi:MAG TPA: 3-oxoacyl-[acyl-carrier-protein] reductase [Acidobacteriota bacterium]|jgi:3-oxoacyl-[acyl-carrier protein] reductase|nr:3-oxoacyl-[acyl-carrier-protein] reductase [Acidobacteriota bacterium]
MFNLTERVALVTGAARGIGRRIAEVLESAGASVVLSDYADWGEELEKVGERSWGIRLDVTDSARIKVVVGRIVDRFGRLDILVNNAGITRDGLLLRMKEDDWKRVLSTNLDSVFLVTREAVTRMMKQRYGRIVNIGSVVGLMGNPGQANYAASKAGVVGFTKAVAREMAGRNITVNAVAPGYVDTAMTRELPETARENLLRMIPLGRMGTVDDIAWSVLFLVSEEAGYITGHVLNVNGGMYM